MKYKSTAHHMFIVPKLAMPSRLAHVPSTRTVTVITFL